VDPDPEPVPRIQDSDLWIRLFSSLTFKMPTKTNLKKSFSAYYFLKAPLHRFLKIKSPKEAKKQWESRFLFLFLLAGRRIREAQKHVDPVDPDPDLDPPDPSFVNR
jgi:hypothetical protein